MHELQDLSVGRLSFDQIPPPPLPSSPFKRIFRGDGETGLERRVRKPRDGKRFSIVSRVAVPWQRASHGYSINHGTAVLSEAFQLQVRGEGEGEVREGRLTKLREVKVVGTASERTGERYKRERERGGEGELEGERGARKKSEGERA